MTERNNTSFNLDKETKAELAEWMIGLLLSDDQPSEEALDEVRSYLADDKDAEMKREVLGKLFLAAFEARHLGAPAAKSVRAEEMWPRIADALGMDPDPNHYRTTQNPNTTIKPLRRPAWHRVAMRVAAVMIPAILVVGAALWLERGERSVSPDPQPVLANVEVSVPDGGQKRIVLPDGSQVWANSSTTLTYNDDFSKERTVTLEGEAFFSVVRDTLSPFRVMAAEMVVEVLGTEFNVKTRQDDPTAEVVLAKGSVKVETPRNKAIELTPGERLTFHSGTSQTIVDQIDAATVSGWRVTDLRFVDSSLEESLRRIAAYYGLDLVIIGTLPEGDLVNFAPAGELPADQILDVVRGITGNFNYQLSQHDIIITPLSPQKE